MMRTDSARLTTVVALGLVTAGCATKNKESVGRNHLIPSRSPYFADLPVPAGFTLVDKETTDYMTGGLRYARHVYEGPSSPVEVRDFFQEQMPLSRWKWIDTENESGVQQLRFRKEDERCDVTVNRESRGLFRKTMIRIRISPIGGVAPARMKGRE